MSEFKIEKGVPIGKLTNGAKPKYPWEEMAVGDSFVATVGNKVVSAMSYWNARHPDTLFKSRTVEGGVRIWRVR